VAKARSQKLKVFRTPIGFHDAYVAAPSQKAALEAWGSESNLFASGAAEQVTEAELIEVPLARPGEVIKVLRGSKAEQVAALGKVKAQPAKKGKSAAPKREKPSRASLERAEEELDALKLQQAKELAEIEREAEAIERRRRELEPRQGREREEVGARAERERARHQRELEAWGRGD